MSDSLVQQRLDAFARITAVGEPYELVDREDIRGPVQTFVNAPTSLRQVYEDAASDVEFVVAEDQRWTFAEFWNDAATIGHLLVHDLECVRAIGWRSRCVTTPSGCLRLLRPRR